MQFRDGPEPRLKGRRARYLRADEGSSHGPVMENLGELPRLVADMRPPKTPFGKAMSYAEGQWPAMMRYLEVPEAELDNNSIEHALRSVVRGRRNWLHVGQEVGGRARGEPVHPDGELSSPGRGTLRIPLRHHPPTGTASPEGHLGSDAPRLARRPGPGRRGCGPAGLIRASAHPGKPSAAAPVHPAQRIGTPAPGREPGINGSSGRLRSSGRKSRSQTAHSATSPKDGNHVLHRTPTPDLHPHRRR